MSKNPIAHIDASGAVFAYKWNKSSPCRDQQNVNKIHNKSVIFASVQMFISESTIKRPQWYTKLCIGW